MVDMNESLIGFGDTKDQEEIKIPDSLPLMPVRDVVILPSMMLPLFVGRETSINAVNKALEEKRLIVLVTQKDQMEDEPGPGGLYNMGVVAIILRSLKLPDGRQKILVQALSRAKILKYVREKPYHRVKLAVIEEKGPAEISVELEALMRNVREQSEKFLSIKGIFSSDVGAILNSVEEPDKLADLVASNLRLKTPAAQIILETIDPVKRLQKVNEYLNKELEVSVVQARIQSEAKEEMSKTHREYFLREQLRAIKKELGDIDERDKEIEEFKAKIKKARMPQGVEEETLKQLNRLEFMHPDAAESSVVRTYLDWLVELPWSKTTKDKLNIKAAQKMLDADHYGLYKVKDRILECLSVRKLNKETKGPILCFVGPPGVGKTSLGRSIARAMGRKFVRMSLGGVRDEAEIRGHRRTYVGALPGRIIQGIKTAGTNNPIFMMDEIDKVGADFRGDPSAALLEVLDPEQNYSFSDHYLNVPFDLSKVMFITTANVTDTIPPALKDRMEVIELSGYTAEEKVFIARKYLFPRQLQENGINKDIIKIADNAILHMISQYTKEAGLRNLEREIGSVFRKVARRLAEGAKGPFLITRANLHKYLGVPKYLPEAEQEASQIGLATGLAWTQEGGEVLHIEVTTMKGKGNLTLTGQLGEVMKESALAALSYTRSRADKLKLDRKFYEELDIHIHVPAGAIPKDGPSAGVTMATALVSALTRVPVSREVAMTGEITLRGRVLPIGGLREKALAALRAGIKKVIIPEQNTKDLEEIPDRIRRRITFYPVKNVDEILELALVKARSGRQSKK
ncbi:MAG: endopeptidase La [Deltaproteobacteria bacterium]|nr:endopeptidase La [Deltaproteobacteria bacterium]